MTQGNSHIDKASEGPGDDATLSFDESASEFGSGLSGESLTYEDLDFGPSDDDVRATLQPGKRSTRKPKSRLSTYVVAGVVAVAAAIALAALAFSGFGFGYWGERVDLGTVAFVDWRTGNPVRASEELVFEKGDKREFFAPNVAGYKAIEARANGKSFKLARNDGGKAEAKSNIIEGLSPWPEGQASEIAILYAKEVEYTVKYLEAGSDAELAPAKTIAANVSGDEVDETAIDIEGYELESDGEVKLTLLDENEKNTITFTYKKIPAENGASSAAGSGGGSGGGGAAASSVKAKAANGSSDDSREQDSDNADYSSSAEDEDASDEDTSDEDVSDEDAFDEDISDGEASEEDASEEEAYDASSDSASDTAETDTTDTTDTTDAADTTGTADADEGATDAATTADSNSEAVSSTEPEAASDAATQAEESSANSSGVKTAGGSAD